MGTVFAILILTLFVVTWVLFIGWVISVLVNILLPTTHMTLVQCVALAILVSIVGSSFKAVQFH